MLLGYFMKRGCSVHPKSIQTTHNIGTPLNLVLGPEYSLCRLSKATVDSPITCVSCHPNSKLVHVVITRRSRYSVSSVRNIFLAGPNDATRSL